MLCLERIGGIIKLKYRKMIDIDYTCSNRSHMNFNNRSIYHDGKKLLTLNFWMKFDHAIMTQNARI